MRLYYIPGACSLAVHIALREAGLDFDLVKVDYGTRRTEIGGDFLDINPKGYVPALEMKEGEILTEVLVLLQLVDQLAPAAQLLPSERNARIRSLEWLSFIATEVHKSFSPLFRHATPEAFMAPGREHLARRLHVIEAHLQQQDYFMGCGISMPDIYLFTVCRWLDDQDLSISGCPSLHRHFHAVQGRRSVRDALAMEGLQATGNRPFDLSELDDGEVGRSSLAAQRG